MITNTYLLVTTVYLALRRQSLTESLQYVEMHGIKKTCTVLSVDAAFSLTLILVKYGSKVCTCQEEWSFYERLKNRRKMQKAKYNWELGEICLRSMYLNEYILLKFIELYTYIALAACLSNVKDHLLKQFQK